MTRNLVYVHFAFTWLAVFTGTLVTGAGPHAGDENAERLDIAIPTVARLHGVTVMITIAISIVIAVRISRSSRERRALQSALSRWIVIAAAQAVVGYVQYFNDVPALLVAVHIVGAIGVMWSATLLLLDLRRPESVAAPTDTSVVSRSAAPA